MGDCEGGSGYEFDRPVESIEMGPVIRDGRPYRFAEPLVRSDGGVDLTLTPRGQHDRVGIQHNPDGSTTVSGEMGSLRRLLKKYTPW